MAAYRQSQFSCIDESEKSPTEITNCVFDTTGLRLACAFGDNRVLIFSANVGNDHAIQEWDRTIFRVSRKAVILQVDWKVKV